MLFFNVPYTSDIITIFVFLRLTSLNMTVHVAANDIINIFKMANFFKLTLIFLVTSLPFTTLSPRPLSYQFSTKLLFLRLQGINTPSSGHFFQGLHSLVEIPTWR